MTTAPPEPLCKAASRTAAGMVLAGLLAGIAHPGFALGFQFPGPAVETAAPLAKRDSYGLPIGPWQSGTTPKQRIEGTMQSTAFRLDTPTLGTLEIVATLRDQLRAEGYAIVFECETENCGGFDFRFDADVLPEPGMHVDLGDFRFLSAIRGAAGDDNPGIEAIGIMVSRSASAGYVQITRVSPMPAGGELPLRPAGGALALPGVAPPLKTADRAAVTLSTANRPAETTEISAIADALLTGGAIVLDGLEFATGAADLTEGRYSSLASLAAWLKANPDKNIALVGHTDAVGGLEGNISISKRRAAAVRARLIEVYGIPPGQTEAQGVGYLSPRDTNRTEAGRTNNRRVEAVLTSTR